jgi:predicted PurR-regulated permease PerM
VARLPEAGIRRSPVRDSVRVLGIYVRAQIFIAAILTVLYCIGFALARVPIWPLIAIIGGVCNIIPVVGSLVPLVLAALLILLVDQNYTHLVIVFATWIIVQTLEGFFLTPRLLGKRLGLKPFGVFLALIAGSLLFGPIGFLLAVPVLAVANVFWRYFQYRRP